MTDKDNLYQYGDRFRRMLLKIAWKRGRRSRGVYNNPYPVDGELYRQYRRGWFESL